MLGPTADGRSSERGIRTQWPPGPPLVWSLALGTGYGAPAISGGRLFQFDRSGDRARLRCLESETGQLLWTFEYPTTFEDFYGYDNGPRSAPVVDGKRVYIFGAEGMLHCLDVERGHVLWKLDTARRFGVVQNFFGVGSSPVVEGDLLIVQIGGSPPESQAAPPGALERVRGNGTGIVAFDKRSGQVRYAITDELASYSSPTLATIDGRRWCFALARGGLVAFEPTSGKVDFQFPWRASIVESVNASNPVVVGRRVFISETYGPGSALLEVKPGGYKVVWSDRERRRDKAMQTHWNTAVYHDGYLYASSGRHREDAELRAVELATGRVAWSEGNLERASLVYVDGHFVVLSENGVLRLVRATPKRYELVGERFLVAEPQRAAGSGAAGTSLPQPLLKYPAWAAPVLSHGLLYVRGRDRLACLELIPARAAEK